jgi:telomerase protein component 1
MEIEKTTTTSLAIHEIRDAQLKLLNMVCACLIHEPTYYSSADASKNAITAMVNRVASTDPEFIFKLALYVRDDLNIRSTANYLIALAANNKNCHPHFKVNQNPPFSSNSFLEIL